MPQPKTHKSLASLCTTGILTTILFFLLISNTSNLWAQTDTLFWFSAPEVNRYHTGGNATSPRNYGTPVYLRMTTQDLPATVTVAMPANPTFTPITINMNAGETYSLDLSAYIENATTYAQGGLPGITNRPGSIENVLAWTSSNLSAAKPYINRNNKGIRITSTASITAYYEISVLYNMDLIALKGQNGLGTQFFVPFQTSNVTRSYPYQFRPYNSIDIVATDDNTKINVTVPRPIWVKDFGQRPAGTYSIWLNKGETAIIPSYGNNTSGHYQTSFASGSRLAGSYVEVDQNEGSGAPIAVITHDDLVQSRFSTNPDYVTDQLVPIEHIGVDYAVIQGVGYGTNEIEDEVFIVGTENATTFTVKRGPANVTTTHTVNRGGSVHVTMNDQNYRVLTIQSDEPVYVLHMSGAGRQKAGAVIPTISKCTGSNRVAFNRTKAGAYRFYLNILAWANPANSAIGHFTLLRDGQPVSTPGEIAVQTAINNPLNFNSLPETGQPFDNWQYARIDADQLLANEAYMLVNEENVFHLGVLNGYTANDAFYGYFSNFNQFKPTGIVTETNSPGGKLCPGETIQLYAQGGAKYSWTPTDFLDNPYIHNPTATNVIHSVAYQVTVSGACDFQQTVNVPVQVGDPVIANFAPNTFQGCATPAIPGGIPEYTFTFTSTSEHDHFREWRFKEGLTGTNSTFAVGNNDDPVGSQARTVTLTLPNNTDDAIDYYVTLYTTDEREYCSKEITKRITVYPYIDINPTVDVDEGCQPHSVQFSANPDPDGHYVGATYLWEFGDGGSDNVQNPTHTYYNNQPPYNPITHSATVTLRDRWNACSVTENVDVTVHPYIEPHFTVNQIEGCSPLDATVSNVSVGGITYWRWYVNGVLESSTTTPPDFSNLLNSRIDNQPETFVLRLVVRNSFGCEEEFSRTIRVFPNPSANTTVLPQGEINCSPLLVNFEATNIVNDDSYTWSLDNIPISNNASGNYTIDNYTALTQNRKFQFKVANEWGCTFVSPEYGVDVHPFIESVIMIDDEEGCSPHTANITNVSSVGATQWDWEIVDGVTTHTFNTQNIAPQSFIYPTIMNGTLDPHDVSIKLTVRNSAGCERIDNKQIRVFPTATATFSADFINFEGATVTPPADMLCSPVYGDFNGSYVNVEDYNWQFGTFGSSLDPNPSNIEFTNTGVAPIGVPVTLTATNRYGCSAPTQTETYIVQPKVTAAFSMETDGNCVPVVVNVNAQVVPGGSYSWSQDGTTWGSFQNATYTITDNKTGADQFVRIQLRVDNGDCYDVSPELAVLVHPEVEAQWNLSDALSPGCSDYSLNITNTSTLHSTPSAPINQTTGYINWEVTDTYGNVLTTGANDNFTRLLHNEDFLAPKQFNLTLKATSKEGCFDTKSSLIEVYPDVSPAFNVEVADICSPMELIVRDASITSSGSTFSWDWDGGAATSIGGQNYQVIYNNIDPNNSINRSITLDLTNSYGCNDHFTYLLSVLPEVHTSFALASGSNSYHCAQGSVTFDNSSTGGTLNYFWDFDDGEHHVTSSNSPVTHSFINTTKDDRIFNVRLVAENFYGCDDVHIIPITVHPKVESDFSFTIPDQCAYPLQTDFINNSLVGNATAGNTTTYNWDYGYSWGGVQQSDARGNNSPHSYNFYNAQANATETYTITLNPQQYHTNSGLTCQDTQTKSIIVHPELIADFSLQNAEGCNPLTVGYTNTSSGVLPGSGGYFTWNYGDNSGGSDQNPASKIYGHNDKTQSHTYPVTLTTTNPLGCKKSVSHDVVVYPWVEALFTLDALEGCTPLNVEIDNMSTSGAYTYQWSFPGGSPNSSTQENPGTITFINSIAPPATLTVSQPTLSLITGLNTSVYPVGAGCAKSQDIQINVFPHVYPSFDGILAGCHPLDINFTNTSSVFGGTNQGDYTWTLGTGIISHQQNHDQTFFNPSLTTDRIYNGKLRAISQHGCKDSIDFNVTVYPKPQSRMELVSDYMACSPFEIEIANLSVGKGINSTLEFQYVFGDGSDSTTFSANNMVHTFQNLASTIEPFTISLYAETENGCNDISYQTIHVYPEVTAQFAFDPGDAACNPFLVTLTNNSTNAWSYEWDFDDDGFISYLQSPTHLFQNHSESDRIYNVKLTASSEYDCVDSQILPLTVYAAPIADFAINPPLKVYTDATFEFINQSAPAADSWTYTWTFGDGYGSNQKHPAPHTYETWGPKEDDFRYHVGLHIENDHCEDEVSHFLTLRPAKPIALYEANEYQACSPLVVYFQNNSLYGHTYEWDFGDGTTSNAFEPIHTFEQAGYYNVSLKVTGDGGERHYFAVFQVFENPTADFVVTPEVVILPNAKVHIYNLSKNGESYIWDLGDGTIEYTRDVVHSYQEMGEYRIHLTAFTPEGCVDTTSKFPAVWVKGAGQIKFPNAFVPSQLGPSGGYYDDVDFSNEVFHPIANAVVEYKLMIFNRWGEQIFESKDLRVGWDGYYKGKLCSQDVYVYRAVGKYSNGETFDVRGNVTLLR